MKKRKFLIILLISFVFIGGLFAQDAYMVTKILETSEITYGQVGYFLAVYLDLVPDEANGRASLDALGTAGFGTYRNTDRPIRFSEIAGLCMKTWKMSGGIMYSIFKTDHYAFRELQAKGYISYSEDPRQYVTGSRFLNLLYKLMEAEGGDDE